MGTVSDKTKLKIELWKEINAHINKIESGNPFFFTILVALFGAVATLLNADEAIKLSPDFLIYMLWFMPIVISVIMAYLAHNFRWVAIARMYASALEKSINNELEEDIYLWNCDIVDKFMAKRNFINRLLLPAISTLLFGLTTGFYAVTMCSFGIAKYWKILYITVIVTLFFACAVPLCFNETIRTLEYELKVIDDDAMTKLIHSNMKRKALRTIKYACSN